MNSRNLSRTLSGYSLSTTAAQFEQRLSKQPRCPVTRYLLACRCFDQGRFAQAVRHMMVAHHAEPAFESAALLVFSGLNLVSRSGAALLPVLLETWDEFRRPQFDRTTKERILLDAFAGADPPPDQSGSLACRLWRLPISTLRVQLREAVRSADTSQFPLLLAPV